MYGKTVLDVNSFFAEFHHLPLNTILLGKSEIRDCLVTIFHHINELGLFHLIERLIECVSSSSNFFWSHGSCKDKLIM